MANKTNKEELAELRRRVEVLEQTVCVGPCDNGLRLAPRLPIEDEDLYHVLWSEDDEEYVGICVYFPSLSWVAPTEEGALEGIKKLVRELDWYQEL